MRAVNTKWVRNLAIGCLLMGQTVLSVAGAQTAIEYTQFAGLYDRQKTLDETLNRLNKMEELRTSAQLSLERISKVQANNIDIQMRYGELIVSRGRDLELFSGELDAAGQPKRAQELAKKSRALLQAGLAIHGKILARAKNHPMAAKIYLGMARTQYSLGQKQAALNSADLGIHALTPARAKSMPEVELQLWIIRGDAAFDLSRGSVARESYDAALKKVNEGSFEEAYVRYKMAWVEYNGKNPNSAIAHLDRLFEITRDRFALKNEAIQDYALFTADLGRDAIEKRGSFKGIFDHLQKVGDDIATNKAMERMALTFSKNGRRVDAIDVEEFLIGQYNMDPINVDRALTVVEWTHSISDKKKLTDKYFWLISNFGPESTWYAAQSGKLQIQRNATDHIEASVRKYSLQLHQEAQKETNADLRDARELQVAKLYDAHIANFSRDNDVPRADASRIHYYRAEIYRRQKNFAEAGKHYDHYLRVMDVIPVAQLDKTDARLKDDAIWSAVQVWAKAIDKDPKLVPNMLGAADRYLKEKGNDPRASQVLLDAALVEEKAGNRVVSAKRLETLIARYPKTVQAMTAVHASLDILNKENDWINLAQRARLFVNTIDKWAPASEKPKMLVELNKILAQTEAKACEALGKVEDRQIEAAICYEKYAKGFEKDAQAPRALLAAADLYDKLKDAHSALGVLEVLVKKYPNSEYAAGGFSRLAQVYEKAFEFEKAIAIYESLLASNKGVKDREKLVERLVTLLYGIHDEKKFAEWINKKEVPDSLRREFSERRSGQAIVQLRIEERAYGYSEAGQFSSNEAQKIYSDLVARANGGRASVEEMLEIHRIKGVFQRLAGRLDKADEEWMAGLKLFWRSKGHTPSMWEAAARLRLEQGSVWETVFNNTNFLKNPTRKAELYQKLEGWYAEVVEMKSPVGALSALWKSAELNSEFAEEIRNSQIPDELLVAGQEKNLAIYKKALIEKTEPMKQKAFVIAQKIAEKAREWKVISPDVLAAMKMVTHLKSGQILPGRVVRVTESEVLKFPWTTLPHWVDLTTEQSQWKEWSLSNRDLRRQLQSQERGDSRRAAFVKLMRDESTSDPDVKKWAKTFVDRSGIQLRIQAMIHDHEFDRANLFLDQYESFFTADAFSSHNSGQLEWAKGNYSVAYLKWVRSESNERQGDFRTSYWSEGWNSLLDSLSSGESSNAVKKQTFSRLAPLAAKAWQKHYLAKLCVDGNAVCSGDYAFDKMDKIIGAPSEVYAAYKLEGRASGFEAQAQLVKAYVAFGLGRSPTSEGIEHMRTALSGLYNLSKFTDTGEDEVLSQYWVLRKNVDAFQDRMDAATKNRVVAGAGS